MFGRYVTTVASFIVLVLLAAVQPAFAWQAPDELPVAPRLIVNDHVQDTEAKPEETPTLRAVDEPADDSLPEVTTSSRRPAPAIVPVEEIIASPVPREETSRRAQPSDDRFDQAIGAGLKPPTAAVPAGGDEANGQPLAKLKATTFKGVQPGATTLEQLTAAWGSPLSESRTDGATLMTYSVDPFPHIDVELQDNVVQSLTIRFKAATSAKQAIEQLGLADLPPAELSDAAGRATGLSFPERGVALLYSQPNSGDRVAEIRLQPIGVDPFLSRVRGDRKHQWQRSLDDLQIAAQLNPADARIWWIKSEVLIHQSEFAKAALAIEKALVIQPD